MIQPFTRTIATLNFRADLICKFAVKGIPHEFSLVALRNRKKNPHYILFFTHEQTEKKIYEDVKIISEISVRMNKLRFNIGIKTTYPEFADLAPVVEETVNEILAEKMS
jgi:hypothetical protein